MNAPSATSRLGAIQAIAVCLTAVGCTSGGGSATRDSGGDGPIATGGRGGQIGSGGAGGQIGTGGDAGQAATGGTGGHVDARLDAASDGGALCPSSPFSTQFPTSPAPCDLQQAGKLHCSYPWPGLPTCMRDYVCVCVSGQGGPPTCYLSPTEITPARCLDAGAGGTDGRADGAPPDRAASDPCSACGPGTACVQRLSYFNGCRQFLMDVKCVTTSLSCPPHSCTRECQDALCPIHTYGLADGGVLRYREDCHTHNCAEELPGAFLCYYGE
jgi:hypothetical protein